jgi:two-component system, chemotaxis family, sensor kinase CheA
MTNRVRTAHDCLEELALKILMIEPGELSAGAELLALAEKLVTTSTAAEASLLTAMSNSFRQALEKITIDEVIANTKNFDHLAQCIIQMQDVDRKRDQAGDKPLRLFCENLTAAGYPVDADELGGQGSAGDEPRRKEGEADIAGAVPPMPDFLQDRDLISGFVAESSEYLESIEVNILELENKPGDPDTINNIFRTFHTIKGVSGFLNLRTINELAHNLEYLLDDVRDGKLEMQAEVIDVVLSVGDLMRSMVRNIKEVLDQGPEAYVEIDITAHLERIKAVQGQTPGGDPPEELASAPEAMPVPAAILNPDRISVQEQGPGSVPEEPAIDWSSGVPEEQPSRQGMRASRVADAIRVNVDKLDGLVNAVGELVIMQALVRQNPAVVQLANPKLTRDFAQLSRITTEVQRTAMSMRMVPIRQTFTKMIRLVRDLSRKSGKQVDLVMSGEETEIDRNMVDSIYDPLVHMVRNSVDHGVQLPAEREKQGKSPTSTVSLRAYQKGGNIIIEIEDDGQGLDSEKIRQKAIERGFIKSGEVLSDYEVNNLIFLPGFSTADRITDVSGRGVGMDVVKKAVEKLRGKVEVRNQPGQGALFLLQLPLTLAIIDGIIVRVGSERYIIPTIAIQESLRLEEANYSTVHGKDENLLIRNTLIPIIRLYQKFGVTPIHTDPLQAIMVVVENEGRRRALMVDELLGKQEVVIKNLGSYLQDTKGIAGGTILGDGRVGLILDLAGLIGNATSTFLATESDKKADQVQVGSGK